MSTTIIVTSIGPESTTDANCMRGIQDAAKLACMITGQHLVSDKLEDGELTLEIIDCEPAFLTAMKHANESFKLITTVLEVPDAN